MPGVEFAALDQSLPARGAWIEISVPTGMSIVAPSRSPHGERGLKSAYVFFGFTVVTGRSPHGERGLKLKFLKEKGLK